MNPARPRIDAALVVIPARDERLLLGACLDSVAAAVRRLDRPVVTVVVLDRCTDSTADVLLGRPVIAVTSTAGCVGSARDAGVRVGLARLPSVPLSRVWIANTDADSEVDPAWLEHHLARADDGADLALGIVRPAVKSTSGPIRAAWAATYEARDGHGHVHGANLGVRASAYLRAGGFPHVSTHEDVQLAALVAQDPSAVVVRFAAAPVATSGRLVARAPDGFASYLDALQSQAG